MGEIFFFLSSLSRGRKTTQSLIGVVDRLFTPLKFLPSDGVILWLPTGFSDICSQEL